jgi:Ca2+:H+ antiporter
MKSRNLALRAAMPHWSVLGPPAALLVLVFGYGSQLSTPMLLAVAAALIAAVLSAVHHAEVVAHRVGEPFGTLVLAVAVTVIEVALVVSMMLSGGIDAATLARDTVFAAVMIVCNGVVGLCLLVGGLRHHVVAFRVDGTGSALAVLAALSTLTLVLPAFTTTTDGPTFAPSQLIFAGVMSLTLYAVFVFVQTVRHRDYFLPESSDEVHAPPPTRNVTLASFALLLLCLVAVVGLAKTLAPSLESGLRAMAAPASMAGVVIAMLVLAPESLAAARAAAANRMQTSLNQALGSALATIGRTIPVVAVV